ncbi:MAG TPA: adenosylmethionine--8-amino-7-oxononanoate transaminase [Polyangiaceae bacterium]
MPSLSSSRTLRKRLVELDKRHLWHPYTAMDRYIRELDPLVIERAQGARLYDVDGRAYLDANASWWASVLGHQHPRLVGALNRQAAQLCHVALAGITHQPAVDLARELVGIAPIGLEHVFFSDDGSTAIETALKLVLQFWSQNGRPERVRMVSLEGGFHGETLGATALGGVEVFRRPFAGALMECFQVPSEHDGQERALAALEELLQRQGDRIAALVLEPMVQGAAGMRIYRPEYLRFARELTRRHDIFLVFDEVFSGYGRTGTMWASEHAGVSPDLMCIAKGFTGGLLPMGATLVTRRIFEGFFGGNGRAFFHGHTFSGNPLGAAVASEVLQVFRDEQILLKSQPKAARIAHAFAQMASLPGVVGTRSLGMIGALDLGGKQGYLEKAGWRVYEEARRRGAYLRPLGNVVYVTPALNISDSDLEELLGIAAESIRAAGW